MEITTYDSIPELIAGLPGNQSIHLECNQEVREELFEYMREHRSPRDTAFINLQDKGYERLTVSEYISLFHGIFGETRSVDAILEDFHLYAIRRRKMKDLKPGEFMKTQIARVSMQDAELYYLEEPLANLDEEAMGSVIKWIEERWEAGARFVTANSSLRYALLMPGTAFYVEDSRFWEVERDEEEETKGEEELEILKIPAKSGNSTLLFEPRDIDYVESMNKCNYLSVRGTLYQTQQPMYELEEVLKKAGFFRCHRSYLVNIQKVERFEKWTKNSYVLILNNKENSQIPLSKGRIEEMKETFHW